MLGAFGARARRWSQLAAAAIGLAAFTLPAAAGVSLTSANKTQVSALGEIITYTFTISGENAIVTGLTSLTMNAPVTNIQCVGLPLAVNGTTTCTADHAVDNTDIGLGGINQLAAGSYNLSTNGGPRGGTVGGSNIFTPYVPPPPPTVSSITPNSGPIAGGTAVSISGSGFTGATGATIGGAAVTSFVVVNNTTITGVTPARTAGAKTVTVQHPNGNGSLSNGFTYLSGTPGLSISDVSLSEGNSGTTNFVFTVSLDQPAGAGGVTFDYATADGTATAGSDFTTATGSTSIGSGSSSTTITVPVSGDTAFEGDETFFLNITNVVGANVTDGQGLGTIQNDDNQPSMSINDVSQNEGNSGSSNMTFTVSLTNPSGSNVTVDYATGDLSATAGSDYTTTTGTLTFTPGQTSRTIDVPITGDTTFEGNESFTVSLTNLSAGASLSDAQGVGAILNDDAAPPTVTAISPNAGRGVGGQNVTISGTNFTGATSVTIGGSSASFSVSNATTIQATTPAGADGTVDVAVTTPGGTATGTALYTYDGTAPGFSGVPANITGVTDPGQPTRVVSYTAPTPTDNRPGATIAQIAGLAPGAAFPIGLTTNTFEATDAVGNTAQVSFTVTVTDNEAPVMAGVPANVAGPTDPGQPTRVVNYTAPTATDNSGESITVVQTAGLPPGSAFPVGITTNAFRAEDSAGNFATASFTVTVTDALPPTIVDLPANQSFNIDFPATTRVVTWTPPTVTDNQAGATIVQTAGPASGAAFPLGTTTVTYTAQDAANNTTTASFTVTVTQTAPGSVRFVVNAQADGTFNFTSAEPVLNFSVDTTGGSGQSPVIQIRPGTFAISFTTPAGIGLTTASCTPSTSTVNTAAGTASLVVASDVATVCTINGLPSRDEAQEAIGAGLQASGALIVANAPNVGRRLDRLNGNSGGGGDITAFGKSLGGGNLPFAMQIGADRFTFALSLSGLRASRAQATVAGGGGAPATLAASLALGSGLAPVAAADATAALSDRSGPRFDIWIEGVFAQFNAAASSDGDFAIVHGGVDYLVTDDILLGVGVQGDWLNMDTAGGRLDSHGYLAGPYLTARISQNLYLDARAAWGGASFDVSPFGTYTDRVESDRELISAALIGEFVSGNLTVRPAAQLTWYKETTEAYVDSLSVFIPSVEIRTGEATFGPDFEWAIKRESGGMLLPYVGFDLIWTFEQDNTATAFTNAPGLEETGLRGRVDAGFTYESPDGVTLGAGLFYDGIGEGEYESWGGTAMLRFGF
ncbi:MAG: HYR domain-containing protein [Alphaproteobacteria bacterium]|nr:HYR domain-containing protein [Alphaproteobacteria bacterium]